MPSGARISRTTFTMSSLETSPDVYSFDSPSTDMSIRRRPRHLQPTVAREMSSRSELGSKLTQANRKYADYGLKLRSKYMKLRLLTEEEEAIARKFCSVGKRLATVKKSLTDKLHREPTMNEWSDAAGLSPEQVQLYLFLHEKSKKRLIEHNMRMVDYLVRKILEFTRVGKEISYFELVAEGITGLTKAAESFDGRKAFYGWAEVWVRAEIYRGITKLRPGYATNHNDIIISSKFHRFKMQLQEKLQRNPTDEEIASGLNVRVSTVQLYRDLANKKVESADKLIGHDTGNEDSDLPMIDCFTSKAADDATHRDFLEALNTLPPTEKRVVALRYGLLDGKIKSVTRTAELMCFTTEAVRKISLDALDKLKYSLFDAPVMPAESLNGLKKATVF